MAKDGSQRLKASLKVLKVNGKQKGSLLTIDMESNLESKPGQSQAKKGLSFIFIWTRGL